MNFESNTKAGERKTRGTEAEIVQAATTEFQGKEVRFCNNHSLI